MNSCAIPNIWEGEHPEGCPWPLILHCWGLFLHVRWAKPGSGRCLRAWCVLQAACDVFCVGDDVNIEKANNSLISNDRSWKRSKFRLTYVAEAPELTQGTDRLTQGALTVGHMGKAQGKGANPVFFVSVKLPAFQPCLSPHPMPKEQPGTVPGPSG